MMYSYVKFLSRHLAAWNIILIVNLNDRTKRIYVKQKLKKKKEGTQTM